MSWRGLWRAVMAGFDSFNLNGNVRNNQYHFAADTEAIRDDWLWVGRDLADAIDLYAKQHPETPAPPGTPDPRGVGAELAGGDAEHRTRPADESHPPPVREVWKPR
jgi:hypothetical protein